MSHILFVTGTDTGVGKTVLTASLLLFLRRSGVRALAMKPFCSGCPDDVQLIQEIQGIPPTREQVNPYYFPAPLAPMVAARAQGVWVGFSEVLRSIQAMAERCERLIVEGAGGLLTPLGEGFDAHALIAELGCSAVIVAPNKLGTINHTRLTLAVLQGQKRKTAQNVQVVLMEQEQRDFSSRSNKEMLRELLSPTPVTSFPYLKGKGAGASLGSLRRNLKKIEKVLARVERLDRLGVRCSGNAALRALRPRSREHD